MDVKYISFQLKNQLKLFVGERSKVAFDSGCKIFDVYLMESASVIFVISNLFLILVSLSFKLVRYNNFSKFLHSVFDN